MPTKFSCLADAWDLAPCPHFHYIPNDLLHYQAGYRKGKVSNFRWLRDRKIGSGILSSSGCHIEMVEMFKHTFKHTKARLPFGPLMEVLVFQRFKTFFYKNQIPWAYDEVSCTLVDIRRDTLLQYTAAYCSILLNIWLWDRTRFRKVHWPNKQCALCAHRISGW